MNPNISFTFLTFLTCTHNSNTIPNQVPPLIRQKKCFKKIRMYQKNYQVYTGDNREMEQLYTTSQVSNITRKAKLSHIS